MPNSPRASLWLHTALLPAVLAFCLTDVAAQTPPTQQPSGQQNATPPSESDAELQATLDAIIGEVEQFSGISVSVRRGVVKLEGVAPSSDTRDRIESVAAGLDGVLFVNNRIELPEPPPSNAVESATGTSDVAPTPLDGRIAEQLRSIFARVQGFESIEVDVAAGVVTLRGSVMNADIIERADELAHGIDGVVFVDNGIEETADLWAQIVPSVSRTGAWIRQFLIKLPLLLLAAAVLWLAWWSGKRLTNRDRFFARITDKPLIQGILKQIAMTVVMLVGLYFALEILDATALVGALLGTAGVVGLALGFAFRDIVENYLASIILSIRQPFQSKDLVEIDGEMGTVIRMNTRETVLMNAEGNHLILPNAHVFKSPILNYTRAALRRFDIAVGVGTDVDLKEAVSLGLGVLAQMPAVVDDPAAFARIETLGDSNVMVRFYGWVNQRESDYGKVTSEAVRLIKSVMDDNQIDMPAPTYQVALSKPTSAPAQDAAAKPKRDLHAEARASDASPERQIEDQIDEERRMTDEVDLLDSESAAARDVPVG